MVSTFCLTLMPHKSGTAALVHIAHEFSEDLTECVRELLRQEKIKETQEIRSILEYVDAKADLTEKNSRFFNPESSPKVKVHFEQCRLYANRDWQNMDIKFRLGLLCCQHPFIESKTIRSNQRHIFCLPACESECNILS